ncbi:hypothetical protein GCM10010446_44250 [Streptomyces enissocaesilis]|uniref:Uncharacterized protein n=1 Tax=Streptomyces enissocaesilis TaxID=332589 RepID=A0ABP6K0P5_9ACTN
MALRVGGTRDRTRAEVTDPDPRALPVRLRAADGAGSGRGPALPAAVPCRREIRQGAGGRTVRCEPRAEPAPAPFNPLLRQRY